MLRCDKGHDNDDSSAFCSTCGQPLPTEGRAAAATISGDAGATDAGGRSPEGPRRTGLIIGVFIAAIAAITGVTLLAAPSIDERYLGALEEEDLRDEFSTEVSAIRNAERVCGDLDDGAEAVGSAADEIGVQFYCDDFSDDFRVLRTATITGTFVLWESGGRSNQFARLSAGAPCSGSGGYSDIGPSTAVVLSNLAGVPLQRTSLGTGSAESSRCRFEFDLDVTEGEDAYVLEIGRRGQSTYSFDEITEPGAIGLVLGQ